MGLSSEQGRVCKKHSAHQEKQGVCPACLRDRLFHLNHAAVGASASVPSFVKAASAHSSSASASVSSSASASSSHDDYHDTVNNNNVDNNNKAAEEEEARVGHGHHRSVSSSDIGSMSFRMAPPAVSSSGGGNVGLKKCRSVAASYSFVPQRPKAMSRGGGGAGADGEKMFSNHNDKDHHRYGNYNRSGGGDYGYGGGKKKKGFWTKLLHLKGKNKEVLIHHPTMPMKGSVY